LYLHTFITSVVAWAFIGWAYWVVVIIIFITHTIIDGLKSYSPDEPKYFLIDQALHLLVILGCWWFTFYDFSDLQQNWKEFRNDTNLWIIITGVFFVTWPAAYLV
jgi:hypothetical protein